MNEEDSAGISGQPLACDLGGGGDQTFHQVTNLDNHKNNEINSNKERMVEGDELSYTDNGVNNNLEDDRTESAEEMDQDEPSVEEVKISLEEVTQNDEEKAPQTEKLPTEKREIADGEEETKDKTSSDADTKPDEIDETSQGIDQMQDIPLEDLGDPRKLDRQQRSNVYNQASTFLQEGKIDKALKYFVAAITGLTENNSFHDLPQCLHQVSNIYFEKKEYEKAVHFIQAEKMYYETALLDIVNLQKHLAENKKQKDKEGSETNTPREDTTETSTDEKVTESKDTIPEITKAREFENLARLCLKEGKPQLALEYCGKATKIYRCELGDDHPVTVGSLDLFAIIYADVGKKLYEDAMKKFGVDDEEQDNTEESKTSEAQQDSSTNPSILRQRNKEKKKSLGSKSQSAPQLQVRFEEYEPSPPVTEQDDWVTTILLMILFFLITILCALIFSYFYCQNNDRSEMCVELKGDLTYWYMKLQYTYKYYTGSGRRV